MRTPKYLSPSSLAKFEKNRREFYERYLCDVKTQRPPQETFMAVGSAFDGFVKHQIHSDIFGAEATKGTMYDRETIFESQVEEFVRDIARERGEDLFQQYVECGSYGALLADISRSPYAPEMEFTVEGEIEGVPMLGKPDLRYITKQEVHVVTDWKVNGSTSKYGASPFKGYQIARDIYNSTTNGKPYKNYRGDAYKDVMVEDLYLEEKCDYWADQLAIYAWLLGEPVGSENFVVRMEQIACRPVKTRDLPRAKFATHMNRVSEAYQDSLLTRITTCWATIKSGHIFDDMTREESDELCELLDRQARMPIDLHPALRSAREEGYKFK